MPAARKPMLSLVAGGETRQNPSRYRVRQELAAGAHIGDPSPWMTIGERMAWFAFVHEMPGLTEIARCRLEIACRLRATMAGGERTDLGLLNRTAKELAELSADATSHGGDEEDI